jgi:hypothetical protein
MFRIKMAGTAADLANTKKICFGKYKEILSNYCCSANYLFCDYVDPMLRSLPPPPRCPQVAIT